MQWRIPARLNSVVVVALVVFTFALLATQKPQFFLVDILQTWDMKEIKRFHLPPPDISVEVAHASDEYYNRLPEHVIYKTYHHTLTLSGSFTINRLHFDLGDNSVILSDDVEVQLNA